MPSWTLPLPAQGLNHGYVLGNGRIYKSAELVAWEKEVALLHVKGWVPPARTPLNVWIALRIPRKSLRRVDADGYVKAVIDAVVGKRRDAWVDQIWLKKMEAQEANGGPGVYVCVEAIT